MYEILVHNVPDGWRRTAILPSTLGFRLVSVIAEEVQLAWVCPVRIVQGGEVVTEFGAPLAQVG
jgi:hypothetical protein